MDLDREDSSLHGEGFNGHPGFDREELSADLEQAGFEQVRFSTVYQMMIGTGGGRGRVRCSSAWQKKEEVSPPGCCMGADLAK